MFEQYDQKFEFFRLHQSKVFCLDYSEEHYKEEIGAELINYLNFRYDVHIVLPKKGNICSLGKS